MDNRFYPSLNTPTAAPAQPTPPPASSARWENGPAPAGQRLPAINARWQASKSQIGGDTYTPRWLQIRAALMGIKGWWVRETQVV